MQDLTVRSFRSTRFLSGLLGLCLGAVVLFSGCSGSEKGAAADAAAAPTVAVAKVKHEDLSSALVLTAEFRPYQEIDVHAKVAGFVKSIGVDVGDQVKAGQLLAVLEIPELQEEVRQAEAAAKQSQEEIRRAESDLERAESAHQVAHLSYTRLAEVVKTRPNLVAQQDLDDAMGRDRVSEAQVAASKAALAAARQQLEVAKANRERVKTLYSYSRIIAPFSGVITKRYADIGSMIQAGTSSQTQAMPVVRLSQNDLLRLVIPAPQSIVAQIRVGSPVQVQVPTLGKTFQGTVARFADQVDTSTRTMHTEVDVRNARLELVPGMYAFVTIQLDRKQDTLALPVEALNREEGRVTVYLVDAANQIKELPVKLGIETPDRAEVVSGLVANDLVVVGNRSQLRPGMTVKPKIVEAGKAGAEK